MPNSDQDNTIPRTKQGILGETTMRVKAFFLGVGAQPANIDELSDSEWLTADQVVSQSNQEGGQIAPSVQAEVQPEWTLPESFETLREKKIKQEYLSKTGPKSEVVRPSKSRTDPAVRRPTAVTRVAQVIRAHRVKFVVFALVISLVVIVGLVGRSVLSDQFANTGLKQLSSGHADEALSSLDRAIQLDGRNANAYYYRGNAYRVKGKLEQAFADYSSSLKLFPKNVSALGSRATLCLRLRNYAQAVDDYTSIFGLADQQKTAQMYNNRAEAYAALGQFKQALQDYNVALNSDASDVRALAGSADCLFNLEQYPDALARYNQLLKQDPQSSAAHLGRELCDIIPRAKLSTANGAYADALKDYDQILKLPQHQTVSLHLARAGVLEKTKDYTSAISDYNAAVALAPKEHTLYLRRARCYQHLKSYKQALSDCAVAAELDPKDADVFCLRGTLMALSGNPISGSKDFTTAISLDSKCATAYVGRGKLSLASKNFADALNDFERALKLVPDDAEALQGRKDTLSATAPPKATKTEVASADALNDTFDFSNVSTSKLIKSGYEKLESGFPSHAVAMFGEVIRRNGNDNMSRRYLAHALLQDSKPSESLAQFRILYRLGVLSSADRQAMVHAQQLEKQLQIAAKAKSTTEASGATTSTSTSQSVASSQANDEKSIPQLQSLAESNPHDMGCRYNLAQAYFKASMKSEGLTECTKCLSLPEMTPDWRKKFYSLMVASSTPR
ncbi:MAG: tetratricopeptide repeat protein [Cyanobacteria bacterium SZAS-4]|nr:tetratricopeptide repeat protein [Cyanobacteria bacterium SZAS-4]